MKDFVQKLLAKTGYTVRRIGTLQGLPVGSSARPIGVLEFFLEDLRARGFMPRGIIDVGAHRGDWTRLALSIFPGVPAILIEPQDEMDEPLGALIEATQNCRRIKAGAGREPGELVQTIWEDYAGSSFLPPADSALAAQGRQRRTPIVTLDQVLAEAGAPFEPDLVKLDIQGFELEALAGGESLFGRVEVFIIETSLIQFYPNNPTMDEVIAFMRQRDYVVYDLPGFGRRPSDGALGQVDVAFVKKNGRFRLSTQW